jgi:hypothetical protein
LVLLVSCSKDDTIIPDPVKYIKVGEMLSSGSSFKVGFYAQDSLFVGYNKVYFKVTNQNGGVALKQATLALHPLMNMMTFSHACPSENPGTSLNTNGYFEGAILFSMSGTNSWSLAADITADGKTETVTFAIDKVKATVPSKKIVVIDSLSTGSGTWAITKYPIALVEPSAWKVGSNPFEITIHTQASMMSFPAATDLSVEITPEMPSMGHGSPNNVNPVHIINGHYSGTVNFTMTGDWRVHLTIKKGDRLITSKAYFDITF